MWPGCLKLMRRTRFERPPIPSPHVSRRWRPRWGGGGGAMKGKGGTVIEEEAVRQGPIEPGEAVLTVAGNLPATHVIHAAAMGRDLKADPDKIAAATRASLAIAEKHRMLSIAFPALGSGVRC